MFQNLKPRIWRSGAIYAIGIIAWISQYNEYFTSSASILVVFHVLFFPIAHFVDQCYYRINHDLLEARGLWILLVLQWLGYSIGCAFSRGDSRCVLMRLAVLHFTFYGLDFVVFDWPIYFY